ncbi:thiamine pyrophosphokinase-related protein [Xylariomycetidae sp. FL2044]|nr:thiamine pyrophosphokinase-related protein [Xylariomycetidae sp. FL2044]
MCAQSHHLPKSNLDLINDCDQSPPNPQLLYRFMLQGFNEPFGHLLQDTAKAITWNSNYWVVDHDTRSVTLRGTSAEERDQRLQETLLVEKEKGTFRLLGMWTGEMFPVFGPGGNILLSIEKIAAPLFGIVTYGVQLLAYIQKNDGPHVWIARRSKDKRTFPGMLDSTVGGSLRTGETPFECMIRESEEEASFAPEFTRSSAVAAGTVNYLHLTDKRSEGEEGLLCPEVQFVYEMKIPDDHVPVPGDGEAEEFILMSVAQLKHALARGEFTPANGEIILDFFVRHGILTFENEPNYIEIVSRLRRSHNLTSLRG